MYEIICTKSGRVLETLQANGRKHAARYVRRYRDYGPFRVRKYTYKGWSSLD